MGNLADITLRGIEVLKNSALVLCENPANSASLFKQYNISTPKTRLYSSMTPKDFLPFIRQMQEGNDIALISDAGTPGISDPGSSFIRFAREKNVTIKPVPGASALSAIMSVCGFQTNPTVFMGFLSEKKNKKREQLVNLQPFERLIVIYETIYKLETTLEMIVSLFPDSELVIGRELTKIHEEILYISDVGNFSINSLTKKGEFVLLINNFRKKISKAKLGMADR